MLKIILRIVILLVLWNGALFAGDLLNGDFSQWEKGNPKHWKNLYPKNLPAACSAVKGVADGHSEFGLRQVVEYASPDLKTIQFSGWSKAENVAPGGEYCLTLDVRHSDNTWSYLRKYWTAGTHDWEMISGFFTPSKPVAEIRYFVLLRKTSGAASFKKLTLTRGSTAPTPGVVRIEPEDEGKNNFVNGHLAFSADRSLPGWMNFIEENPFRSETDESGTLRVGGVADRHGFGFKQTLEYRKPSLMPINLSGWSKAENVTRGAQYCLYLDIRHTDGSWTYSVMAHWKTGSHDWERTELSFRPKKPVASISVFALLRHGKGKALFRDFSLTRGEPELQFHYASVYSMAPWKPDDYRIRFGFYQDQVDTEYRLLGKQGEVLSEGRTSGKSADKTVYCPGKPVRLQLSAFDGKSRRTQVISIRHVRIPKTLANGTDLQFWCADSMRTISPLTFPEKEDSDQVRLSLAGGERESIQLLISNAAPRTLTGLTPVITEFKNAAGQPFPGTIKLEKIGYIPRASVSNAHPLALPDAIYWLPDPLLPVKTFSVPSGATQGLWLTVSGNRHAPAGVWHGAVRIQYEGKNRDFPCTIVLYGFSLPEYFSYRSAFAVMDGYLAAQYPNQPLSAIRRKAWDILLDHRLNPDDITRTELPEIEDLRYARSRGMNYFTICNLVPKPERKVLWTLTAPPEAYDDKLIQEFRTRFDPYVAQLQKYDLDKIAAFYGFDERGPEYFPVINRVHRELRQSYPAIPLLSTSSMYRMFRENPQRKDCFGHDWYCPPTSRYDRKISDQLRQTGRQVWWYTCCGPYYPYANFSSLEYPFYEGRLIAWMTYFNRADGFLFWHTNNWLPGTPNFSEESAYQPDFRSAVISGSAGDGQFLYPGKNGPIPSIRLANLRDGSEDYDYLFLLNSQGAQAKAMALAKELVPEPDRFERDPKRIRAVRQQLAEAIEAKLNRKETVLKR